MFDLSKLLGVKRQSYAWRKFRRIAGDVKREYLGRGFYSYDESKNLGVHISFERRSKKVDSLWVYFRPEEDCGTYTGPLPCGITGDDTRQSFIEKLKQLPYESITIQGHTEAPANQTEDEWLDSMETARKAPYRYVRDSYIVGDYSINAYFEITEPSLIAYLNLGLTNNYQRKWAKILAEKDYRQAALLLLEREKKDPSPFKCLAYDDIADYFEKAGDQDEAERYYLEGLESAKVENNGCLKQSFLVKLAKYYIRQNRISEAQNTLEIAAKSGRRKRTLSTEEISELLEQLKEHPHN